LIEKRFVMDRRLPRKAFVVVLTIACFLSFTLGAVSGALAAEPTPLEASQQIPAQPGVEPDAPITVAADTNSFETWPKKTVEPGVEPSAAKAGEAAGQKTATGISAGTWGWIAAGGAVILAIILIAGSGGSSGGTTTTPIH